MDCYNIIKHVFALGFEGLRQKYYQGCRLLSSDFPLATVVINSRELHKEFLDP
jgi:hypothetical protein